MNWKAWLLRLLGRSADVAIQTAVSGSGISEVGKATVTVALEPVPALIEKVSSVPDPTEQFLINYEKAFGVLNISQRSGLKFLLDRMEREPVVDVRRKAYMLATVKHECANTWQPIEEHKGALTPYGWAGYYGRGYVQLTHKENYDKLGKMLGVDLVKQPELALDSETAYRIMSVGMRLGLFTGVGWDRYINSAGKDYLNARRIINGMDRAGLIADYAVRIEACLGG